jgi:uroporphyrin-III C-methyltransferase/precorrin-2 dehydrogenase/sirohydrochlorin ferrochelatase
MRFLPVFLDVTQGTVGLIGSGPAALAKLRLLQSAGGRVRWYVEELDTGELAGDVESGLLKICTDDPRSADFSDLIAVVSAAGEPRDAEIAATWSSRSAPAAHHPFWPDVCANASRHCCRRVSAISRR